VERGICCSGTKCLIPAAGSAIIPFVPMLLNHAFSNCRWQRNYALPAMTLVIVKGTRESVRDR
jgi:hypothetical protein